MVIEAFEGALKGARGKRCMKDQLEGKLAIAREYPRLLEMMCNLYAEIGKDIASLSTEEEKTEYRLRLMELKKQAHYTSDVPIDER